MAANAILNNYIEFELKKAEDENIIKNVALAIKKEFVSTYPEKKEEKISDEEHDKILNMTSLSVKMYSNSYYKSTPYLDSMDIEQIKNALKNYASKQENVKEFKKALVDDLTEFGQQIKEKHFQKISEMVKEKHTCENEAKHFESLKNQLVMERLSKIVWPYDSKTKEYDTKIAALQSKVEYYTQKITNLQSLRPMATEKDILLYQMHLKEKYSNK